MGTRGAFGFTIDGIDKVTYNQFDSYYSGRGLDTVHALRTILKTKGEDYLREQVRKLKLVNEHRTPTKADIAALAPWTDLNVSNQDTKDWYCLTRKGHGDVAAILQMGYALDAKDFLSDSLFCEYAYIINCDTRKLEVYRGFQDKPHTKGRFADRVAWLLATEKARGHKQYYPVALVAEYSFDRLPTNLALLGYVEDMEEFRSHDPQPCKTCGVLMYEADRKGKFYDLKGDHADRCTKPSL